MSFIVIAFLVLFAALVVWIFTPSGEKAITKADASVSAVVSAAKAEVTQAKTAVDSAVTDIKKV
jgi:F0F1-type ATP synthase membrane subunit b/b'